MDGTNTLVINREIDGFFIKGLATYQPQTDSWRITVTDHYGEKETRAHAGDAWMEMIALVDYAMARSRQKQLEES